MARPRKKGTQVEQTEATQKEVPSPVPEAQSLPIDNAPRVIRSMGTTDSVKSTVMLRFSEHVGVANLVSKSALLIGCGSIGSWAAVAASKMGIMNWSVVDFDTVELHNTANQVWGPAHIGKPKVDLMASMLTENAAFENVVVHNSKFRPEMLHGVDIVLLCVDKISVRKEVIEAIKSVKNKVCLVFDARIGGGVLEAYAFDPSDPAQLKEYEESFPNSEEVAELKCTEIGGCGAPLISAGWLTCVLTELSKSKKLERLLSLKSGVLARLDIMRNDCSTAADIKRLMPEIPASQAAGGPKAQSSMPGHVTISLPFVARKVNPGTKPAVSEVSPAQ